MSSADTAERGLERLPDETEDPDPMQEAEAVESEDHLDEDGLETIAEEVEA